MISRERDHGNHRRLVGVDFRGLGDDPLADIALLSSASSEEELALVLRQEVDREVTAILDAVAGCDAFDVIELVRMREFPPTLASIVGTDFDGSGAVVELITLALMARRGGRLGGGVDESAQPHLTIPELHDRAKRLIRLAAFRGYAWAELQESPLLARIAAIYQGYFVGVRSLRYESIELEHNRALFGRPELERLLREYFGFTYDEFEEVRRVVQLLYSETMTSLRDVIGDLTRSAGQTAGELSDEQADEFRSAMVAWMFLPGNRAAFRAADIAETAGLAEESVVAVLAAFSVIFEASLTPSDAVHAFLRGDNPLWSRRLVQHDDWYLMTSDVIGSDSLRSVFESALHSATKSKTTYERTRKVVSEQLATEAISGLLGTPALRTSLEYFAPLREATDLSADCSSPKTVGKLTEADALFVIDDVAICVEVKGRAIHENARRADLARLQTEVRTVMASAVEQARRLENLIVLNGGVWTKHGSWLDLGNVREVRSVVVGLDYFGPLSTGLGDLVDASLIRDGTLPWIVSMHDLHVIGMVIDQPSEFLLYLRRRTDSGVAKHFRAMDELDLFMLFLSGGLYVEPDPDEVRRAHPHSPPATRQDRQRHERSAVPTTVGTYTDPLDAWMYWLEDKMPDEVAKPRFRSHAWVAEIVRFLSKERPPGWIRCGADLLGLSEDAQASLACDVDRLVDQTRADAGYHTMVQGFAGMWGYPALFVCTTPYEQLSQSLRRLRQYMVAKKHQLRSDRCLGLLLDEIGVVRAVIYLNDTPRQSEVLDALVSALRLQEPTKRPRAKPPLKKKSPRRLKRKKRRR